MLQVAPDWQYRGTKAELETYIAGGSEYRFDGPGFYLSDHDTLLVIRNVQDNTWNRLGIDQWVLYCYNIPYQQTIFAHIQGAPIRVDVRS